MLQFEDENHTYTWNGQKVPSVTQIISSQGLIEHYGTELALMRGKYVHQAIEYYLDKQLDEASLDPVLAPYLISFSTFLEDTNFVVHGFEAPMYHKIYAYAGKPDMWGRLNGRSVLIDIKTGGAAPWHIVQLAAYRVLCEHNGYQIDSVANLYLNDNGKYRLNIYQQREITAAWSIFVAALTLYRFKDGG